MRTVFADSFYFFALENDQDPAHAKAVAFLQAYRGRLLTTGWVLTEVGDGFSHAANRPAFLLTIDALRAEPNVRIIACSDELLDAGISCFASTHPGQNFSPACNRVRHREAASLCSRRSKKRGEPGGREMAVVGKRLGHAEPAHDRE